MVSFQFTQPIKQDQYNHEKFLESLDFILSSYSEN